MNYDNSRLAPLVAGRRNNHVFEEKSINKRMDHGESVLVFLIAERVGGEHLRYSFVFAECIPSSQNQFL